MIRVTLRKADEAYTGFEIKGHAGFAAYGKDIVCAAVSALSTACVNALESVAGVKARVVIQDGDMAVSLPENAGHDAQVILRSMVQGLRDVAEQYPKHLQLTEK